MERLWLLAIYPNTNLRSAVEWLNGAQQLTINTILQQNLPKFILRNSVTCFFQDQLSMQRDLCHTPKISRRFASEWRFGPWCCDPDENRIRVTAPRTKSSLWSKSLRNLGSIAKIYLHALLILKLLPGWKPHWPSYSFDSTISRHFLSRHLAYTFPGKLRSDIPLWFVHCLRSPFLNIEIITPVCQSLGVLPNFYATWHTRVNQRIPSPVSAFNISGLISSSPAAFLDFIPLIVVATSAAVKTSSSFSSIRMLPAESLMEYVTLDLLPRKRQMVCQNTLFAKK